MQHRKTQLAAAGIALAGVVLGISLFHGAAQAAYAVGQTIAAMQRSVARHTSAGTHPSMIVLPSAIADSMSARCVMDLSPGMVTDPRNGPDGWIIRSGIGQNFIRERICCACSSSRRRTTSSSMARACCSPPNWRR